MFFQRSIRDNKAYLVELVVHLVDIFKTKHAEGIESQKCGASLEELQPVCFKSRIFIPGLQ